MKLKLKSAGSKKFIVANVPQPAIKENKIKPLANKVIYTSKRGSKAIFDSVRLCAMIFGKDESTIRYKIKHPSSKDRHNSWLKGGKLEYYNN